MDFYPTLHLGTTEMVRVTLSAFRQYVARDDLTEGETLAARCLLAELEAAAALHPEAFRQ